MQLPQLLIHYQLDSLQLIRILISNQIYVDLRLIKRVPDEWYALLTESTGIERPASAESTLKSATVLHHAVLATTQAGNQQDKLTLDNLDRLLHDEPVNISIDTKQRPSNREVTRIQGAQRKLDKNNDKATLTKEYFWGFVIFYIPGKYGFVKRIYDFDGLDYDKLKEKSDDSYYIKLENEIVSGEELVICSSSNVHSKKKTAQIESLTHSGIVSRNRIKVLSSLLPPTNITGFKSDKPLPLQASFESFTLHVTRGKDVIKLLAKPEQLAEQELKTVTQYFEKILFKDEYSSDNLESLKALKDLLSSNEDSLDAKFQEAFENQKANVVENNSKYPIEEFIKNWASLCPSLLTFENLDSPDFSTRLLDYWFDGLLPLDFWGEKLDQVFGEYCTQTEALNGSLQDTFLKLQKILIKDHEQDYNRLLKNYFSNIKSIGSAAYYHSLYQLATTAGGAIITEIVEDLHTKLNAKTKLELWLNGSIQSFPNSAALENFSNCPPQDQDKIVEHFTDNELQNLIHYISPDCNKKTKSKCRNLLEQVLLSKFDALALDIESDGETVEQLAWGNREKWFYDSKEEGIKDLQLTLQNRIASSNPLLVGHNIIEFDCAILAETDVGFEYGKLWDTLSIEVVLNPGLKTYALRTTHNAIDDAKLALELFVNQVLRIICLDEDSWNSVNIIFPSEVRELITELRRSTSINWFSEDELQQDLLSYLRPQPQRSSLVNDLIKHISDSNASVKVVLASFDFWEEFASISNLEFYTSNKSSHRFWEIDKSGILEQLKQFPYESLIVKRYLDYCRHSGFTPMLSNMAPYTRNRLSDKIDFATCINEPQELRWNKEQVICLDVNDLALQEEQLLNTIDAALFVVEPDLLSLTFKSLLKELDLSYLINSPSLEHLWIKFSGGQSFIELTKEQALSLGIENYSGITNFWIEKYLYGKYRIWGNYSWENHLAGFSPENITIIERDKVVFNKQQASYLVVDQKKLQNKIGITRFNPETIYRSRYWVVQKELIEGIIRREKDSKPLILLVQRQDEVGTLEQYFHSLGYYIPSRDAALGRRLELLHKSNRSRRILIGTITEASQIINSNYLGPLNVAYDSFNLYENYFLAKGSKLFYKSTTTSAEIAISTQEDSQVESDEADLSNKANQQENNRFLQRDIYFLLKLQIPIINRLRSLLLDDNPESKLWLMDARIEDFVSLGETWNASKETMEVWQTKESYDHDAKKADVCINSPKPDTELPFSLDEIKSILSSVFLPQNASWHNYQQEYLDKILPAQNNLLVSLPTGGGKSLLFQAPALFRSSFTNRLTIVITPLKALMEDQVNALWKLGFYGSVDYINQDKRDEVQHIYRRLAGGELALLFITPERFRSGGFIKAFTQRFENDGGLEYAVYDEAHCISQWGHEFRPDYLYSGRAVQRYKDMNHRKFPILLFSATVSEMIYRDFNAIFK